MSAPLRLACDELRAIDRLAQEEFGLPGIVLMENAGAGAARIALALLGDARRATVLAGPGNNGGDGWVVARHLANHGVDVRVLSCVDPSRLRGDAAVMAAAALRMRVPCDLVTSADHPGALRSALRAPGLFVDALLGTGASGPPRPPIDGVIAALATRDAAARVLALDLPSGLDADTGVPQGPCVAADVTATFAAHKLGFAAPGAARWTGRIELVDIGVPAELLRRAAAGRLTLR